MYSGTIPISSFAAIKTEAYERFIEQTSDRSTWRVEVTEKTRNCSAVFQEIADKCNTMFANEKCGGKYIPVVCDPGYSDGKGDQNSSYDRHYGAHVLYSSSTQKAQYPHIDGIGRPVKRFPKSLKDFSGPLSVSVILTSGHKNTQFGGMLLTGDMFEYTMRGKMFSKTLLETINTNLKKHATFFTNKLKTAPLVCAGVFNVFPKDLQVHCGAPANPKSEDHRLVLYFDLCREQYLEAFLIDRMQTTEFALGFQNGKFSKFALRDWQRRYVLSAQCNLAYLQKNHSFKPYTRYFFFFFALFFILTNSL